MRKRKIHLLGSDLNGTWTHSITMSHMANIHLQRTQELSIEKIAQLNNQFRREYREDADMERRAELTPLLGPSYAISPRYGSPVASFGRQVEEGNVMVLPRIQSADSSEKWSSLRGLSLGQAISYSLINIPWIKNYDGFGSILHSFGIPIYFISTGFDVTMMAIKEILPKGAIHGYVSNKLYFAPYADPDPSKRVSPGTLERLVCDFITEKKTNPHAVVDPIYDTLRATGLGNFSLVNAKTKPHLLFDYAKKHFPSIPASNMAYMGDDLADDKAIIAVAEKGGVGIPFNYSSELEQSLDTYFNKRSFDGSIRFIDSKGSNSDMYHAAQACFGYLSGHYVKHPASPLH